MDEMLRTMSQHGSGAALARTLSPRYSAGEWQAACGQCASAQGCGTPLMVAKILHLRTVCSCSQPRLPSGPLTSRLLS